MRVEIESVEDYVLVNEFTLLFRQLTSGKTFSDADAAPHVLEELELALDDYRQIHWPLGGEPKP